MNSLNFGMNYGSLLGLLLVVISVLFYAFGIFDFEKPVLFWTINYLILFFFLIYSSVQYRNLYNCGFISYGESLKIIVTVAVFSSFILGFWRVILIKFISPEYIELYIQFNSQQVLENAEAFEKLDLSIDELLDNIESSRKKFKPIWIIMDEIRKKALGGLLLGLIISIFTKKDNPNEIL